MVPDVIICGMHARSDSSFTEKSLKIKRGHVHRKSTSEAVGQTKLGRYFNRQLSQGARV